MVLHEEARSCREVREGGAAHVIGQCNSGELCGTDGFEVRVGLHQGLSLSPFEL